MQIFHIVGEAPLYTNTFLLLTEAGRGVVIDPAAPAQEYEQILHEHGARLAEIFCTHGHFDHVGSAEALRRAWGARLWCEAADVQNTQMYPLASADCGYPEGEPIAVDELRFTAWHTPGHTQGSVVLLCGSEYLFAGDTLFAGSIGRTDLPGGSARQMEQSLRKLAALPIPPAARVLPGHGEFSTFETELGTNWYLRER